MSDGHDLAVSNLDKALWPARAHAQAASPSATSCAISRGCRAGCCPTSPTGPSSSPGFPAASRGKSFYQKHWDDPPAFARTVAIYSSHGDDRRRLSHLREPPDAPLARARWRASSCTPGTAAPTPSRTPRRTVRRFTGSEAALERSVLNYPDFVVFDLDPYDYSGARRAGAEPELHRRAFNRTRRLALQVREQLERLGLTTYVKTSGRTGLHLYLPIVRDLDFDAARDVAETIAKHARSGAAAGGDDRVGGRAAAGEDLLRLQPEHPRQVARGALLHRGAIPTPPCPRRCAGRSWSGSIPPTSPSARCPTASRRDGDPWDGILSAKQDLGAILGVGGAA